MVANKPRLYVALYPTGNGRNGERRYHWGLLSGPKIEKEDGQDPGKRYHVKNTIENVWLYCEENLEDVKFTPNLLARIMIAKIEDFPRFESIVRNTAVV